MGRNPQYFEKEPKVIIVKNFSKEEKTYLEANNYEFVNTEKTVMKKKSLFKRIFT